MVAIISADSRCCTDAKRVADERGESNSGSSLSSFCCLECTEEEEVAKVDVVNGRLEWASAFWNPSRIGLTPDRLWCDCDALRGVSRRIIPDDDHEEAPASTRQQHRSTFDRATSNRTITSRFIILCVKGLVSECWSRTASERIKNQSIPTLVRWWLFVNWRLIFIVLWLVNAINYLLRVTVMSQTLEFSRSFENSDSIDSIRIKIPSGTRSIIMSFFFILCKIVI